MLGSAAVALFVGRVDECGQHLRAVWDVVTAADRYLSARGGLAEAVIAAHRRRWAEAATALAGDAAVADPEDLGLRAEVDMLRSDISAAAGDLRTAARHARAALVGCPPVHRPFRRATALVLDELAGADRRSHLVRLAERLKRSGVADSDCIPWRNAVAITTIGLAVCAACSEHEAGDRVAELTGSARSPDFGWHLETWASRLHAASAVPALAARLEMLRR
jgi:hypothetical protein